MRPRRRRLRIIFVLLGLALGLGIGVAISWGVLPRMPKYARISELRDTFKDDYVVMVSMAYARDNDLPLAKQRLALLHVPTTTRQVSRIAETAIANREALAVRRSLAKLAYDLGATSAPILAIVATPARTATASPPATPTRSAPTASPTHSFTPTLVPPTMTSTSKPTRPITRTPSPVPSTTAPSLAYIVEEQGVLEADSGAAPGQLIILVATSRGEGLPGIKVQVEWEGGRDTFITGLHPKRDPGYADFAMEPGMEYRVFIVDEPSERAEGLLSEPLPDQEDTLSSWRVLFVHQP